MQQAANAAGAVFVDQSALCQDPLNFAANESGNPYQSYSAINGHPGNRGMKAIADSLFGAMVACSAPEPKMLSLLGCGLVCAVWRHCAWRRWS